MTSIDILHKNLWYYSIVVIIASCISVVSKNLNYAVIGAGIGFSYWTVAFYKENHIRFPGGIPNSITFLRFLSLLIVTVISLQLTNIFLGILFTLICLGDIFDGYFARKLNQSSLLGEYLDKETDALFVLLLSIIIYLKIHHALWVLIPGFIRYIYFVMIYFFLKNDQKEHKDPWARIIAVYVFISIIAMFILPIYLAKVNLVIATAAILYSFGRSVLFQIRVLKF